MLEISTVEFKQVEAFLKTAGSLAEQARLEKKSLNDQDRLYIDRARRLAKTYELSEGIITAIMEEGAEVTRRNLAV